ncbi:MAG: hypothetical protein AAF196_07180 [Planctomycetota bacterium]
MNFEPSTPKRIALYTTGAVAASVLAYVGWIRETSPDVGTLLSGVQIHVGMAATVPADTDNQDALKLRTEQVALAWEAWRKADEAAPGDFEVLEWKAVLLILEGEPVQAADVYADLATKTDDAELRSAIQLREVEMRRSAQGVETARALLDAYGLNTAASDLTRISLDVDQGDTAGAIRRVRDSFVREDGEFTHKSSCIRILQSLAGVEAATSMCLEGPIRDSLRDYELARLKADAADTDNAVGLLMHSLNQQDEDVRTLFTRERGFWNERLGEDEFNRLNSIGAPAAPLSGR